MIRYNADTYNPSDDLYDDFIYAQFSDLLAIADTLDDDEPPDWYAIDREAAEQRASEAAYELAMLAAPLPQRPADGSMPY